MKGEAFVKLPRDVLESTSWQQLGINARRFLDFLMIEHMRHGGKRNGFLLAPQRQLYAFGIGEHFVTDAIAEAELAGLVDCKRGIGRRPSYYALTWLPLADGTAPSNRWSVVPAVSTFNACQTAGTKPVVTAKQQAQSPKLIPAKQQAPSRTSYQGGGNGKVVEGELLQEQVRAEPVRAQSAPAGKPEAPAARCGWYVTDPNGFRICGKPAVDEGGHCAEHARPPSPEHPASGKSNGQAAL
jgi:hypothetical protein